MGWYPARVHPFEVEMARGMVLEALNCRNTLPDSSHKIGEKVQVKISHLKRNRNIMKICTCCTLSKYYMGTPRVSTLQVRSGTIWRTSIYINLIQFTSHWVQQRVFLFSRSSNTERNFTPASQQFHWHICNPPHKFALKPSQTYTPRSQVCTPICKPPSPPSQVLGWKLFCTHKFACNFLFNVPNCVFKKTCRTRNDPT